MTYDQLMQWFLPLTISIIGLVCLFQAERLAQEAARDRLRQERVVKLFLEAMLLVKIGARDEAEECLERAMSGEGE